MRKPRVSSIKRHFEQAKTIRCLKKAINIDISHTTEFVFNKETNSYTSVGGAVTFWENGNFAEILDSKVKKCKCENCECNKSKTLKRNTP